MSKLGKRVADEREALGISQARLGKALGLGVARMGRIESGDSPLTADLAQQIAELFGITTERLYGNLKIQAFTQFPPSTRQQKVANGEG